MLNITAEKNYPKMDNVQNTLRVNRFINFEFFTIVMLFYTLIRNTKSIIICALTHNLFNYSYFIC